MPELVRVITGDWNYHAKVAKARSYSAIFIPSGKGSGSNEERYVGGTEQQEGDDISKQRKCK